MEDNEGAAVAGAVGEEGGEEDGEEGEEVGGCREGLGGEGGVVHPSWGLIDWWWWWFDRRGVIHTH